MKRFLLALMLIGFAFSAFAQKEDKGNLQIGIQGGASLPQGKYKTIPNTKTGFYSGLFIDKYFNGNKFGIGVDLRYIYNGINRQDSFYFDNGFIETTYKNKLRFQDYLFTVGPTYKYTNNTFHLEAYVKGGIMMQSFPEYMTSIHIADGLGGYVSSPLVYTINDVSNKANSWAGLAGLRFNYAFHKNFAVFAHVDYVQAIGNKFGSKSNLFKTESLVVDNTNPLTSSTFIKDLNDHYIKDSLQVNGARHQTINAGIGIKYIFGAKPAEKRISDPKEPIVKYDDIPKSIAQAKDLQVVVKDKQTNLSLSGVTVSIEGENLTEKSITDANGQATKVIAIQPGKYTVYGEKNGIKTPILNLTETDFKSNSSVIFKEIYHDDPRFTLVGETFDCNIERYLPNINTVLTNSRTKVSIHQTSDVEGKFIFQLDPQSDFTVMANQQGRYSQTELITTNGLDRSQTLYVTLKLGVCDLVLDGTWVLKNILYDFDKSNIRPDAALILDNVVSVMNTNPSLRIELSSHTDSRGNDDYNLKLSQRRADAAVNYLVSKGISRSRLVAKGYGETRLLNHCGNGVNCSEEQHQENRRTEIKIIDYSK